MPTPRIARWISTSPTATWRELPPSAATTAVSEADATFGALSDVRWKGFGCCANELGWEAMQSLRDDDRAALMSALFAPDGELGFSFNRMPIGANDYSLEWYSHAEVAGDLDMQHFSIDRDRPRLIPYLKAIQALNPSMRLFASPWSPPTWLKLPAVNNFGTLVDADRQRDAYALYFLRFIEAYAAEGLPIAEIHPQNEPVSTQKFPSCVMTGDEFRIFIGRHLGPLLAERSPQTAIWLGTINGPEHDERRFWSSVSDYAFTVLTDPEAARHVRGISYQWAGKYALARTRMGWPTMPLIQSEHECGDGDNTWTHAWYVADLFHHYLAHDVEAYVAWNPMLLPGGRSSWGWRQNALATIDPVARTWSRNPEWFIFRHFTSAIRAGAQRRAVHGAWAVNATAYRNADGTQSLVVRNPFDRVASISLSVDGVRFALALPPTSMNTVLFAG